MRLVNTLIACTDCVAFVANGTVPEHNPTLPVEIEDYLALRPGQHLVNHDDGEDWFSWNSCECCGAWEGGNRNQLAILETELA